MPPAEAFGRRLRLTAPHVEIRVGPGDRWRPAGATVYRASPEQAARVVREEWGSAIVTELSPQQAHEVAQELLGPLGDLDRASAGASSGRAGAA